MKDNFSIPILLMMFNRPEDTLKVFLKIREIKPKLLFISSDGPRKNYPSDIEACEKCLKIIDMIDWDCEVKTLVRKVNLGCGVAPAQAITWFFNHVKMGIIIEDDVIPDISFFGFCERMLLKYEDNEKVMHISGCYFLNSFTKPSKQSYYFTKHVHVWGWATWSRAWEHYCYNLSDYKMIESKKVLRNYYGAHYIFWRDIYLSIKNGRRDIWDYQWMYAIFKNSGIAINPNKNLTKNIGFNQDATHTTNEDSIFNKVELESLSEIIDQNDESIDTEKDNLYYKHFLDFDLVSELRKRNKIWYLKQILKKLKNGLLLFWKKKKNFHTENVKNF
ncbi:MAG: nucleotide-diphospho-sugar transferase [Pedobacter sp.]|nr:MAG: nucleotide-diphospho-sugar transferase [Pedobacter sp.]